MALTTDQLMVLIDNLDEFGYRFNRHFWESELPLRLLNACMDQPPVRLVTEKGEEACYSFNGIPFNPFPEK